MSDTSTSTTKSMDDIVALCRRRGFIFQSSEIYGGINGFWDYGPLGAQLKRNLKDAWWEDVVRRELPGPDGKPVEMVGLDTTIITHPKVWEASGHIAGFNDPMVDDKETKQRFRADHLFGAYRPAQGSWTSEAIKAEIGAGRMQATFTSIPIATTVASSHAEAAEFFEKNKKLLRPVMLMHSFEPWSGSDGMFHGYFADAVGPNGEHIVLQIDEVGIDTLENDASHVPSPFTGKKGSLTQPRQFNLMFISYAGAIQSEESKVYLRPETAQGIFINFWNVVDTSRVRIPFGIAQQGKAFRNEVTPRNFTFRSREFEQMEIEFFIHPSQANEWYAFWRDNRFNWWKSVGLAGDNLQLREHEKDELAHYAKEGAGTSDIEYRFPFTAPGFGELEGVAHRADFDLKAHANMCGKGEKMRYFDQEKNERYFPHVIEPSAGADRGTLAILCEAYTKDDTRPSGVFMNFTPRMAPIKAAVFPLVNKDGMPEVAEKLYRELRGRWMVDYDAKQSIGKRYARMDEAGTPYCFTIDGDTLNDQTVTVRHRDSQQQERIGIDQVSAFLAEKIG